MITEIADRIYSASHSIVEGKNGIVFGKKGALAIDAGMHQSEGEAMATFIRERGFEPDRLVFTHCHNDHILGGKAFEQAEIFADVNAPAVIRRHMKSFARFWEITDEEASSRILRPTVLFRGEMVIDLGGRAVRLIYTPGHSDDHISAYIEDSRLLIAGDVVVNAMIPAIMDGDSRILEATLERLKLLPIDSLLPGHGTLVQGTENVQGTLQWTINYLKKARERVRATQTGGGTKEAALEAASYEELVGSRLPLDRHKMLKRHHDTVGKIFDEELAARSHPWVAPSTAG